MKGDFKLEYSIRYVSILIINVTYLEIVHQDRLTAFTLQLKILS